MASDRMRKIRAQKRQEFRDRQNRNRIISQLEALYGAGYTADEIREAGNDAFRELGGTYQNGRYIVKDGDNLEKIAQTAGVDATDILKANPDMSAPQTGMVINVPSAPMPTAPGTQGWRDRNIYNTPLRADFTGGIGLPSNAALGGTTTNPLGTFELERRQDTYSLTDVDLVTQARLNRNRAFRNRMNRTTPYNPWVAQAQARAAQPGASPLPTWQQLAASRAADRNVFEQVQGTIVGGTTIAERAQLYRETPRPAPATAAQPGAFQAAINSLANRPGEPQAPGAASPTPPAPSITRPASPASIPSTYPGGLRRWVNNMMNQINTGYTPNSAELKVLENMGIIKKKPPTPAFAGGGGFASRSRRGGGGGGAPRPPRQTGSAPPPEERLPAFAGGGGFQGLINWRI